MSCDLGRLKSASALRDWEEDRAKAFASWASASKELLESLRAAVDLGETQHLELQQLLSLRSAADRAYAQALAAGLPSKEDDTAPSSPVLTAVAALQRSVSQLRESFALNVIEGSLLTALANASSEFKTTAEGLLAKLGKGVSEAEQVNQHVQEAMSNFRRASIQDPRRRTPAAGGGWFAKPEPRSDPDDGWLQEHRYRRAVASLRERQRTFTADLCSAVEELRRLELWREEVVRKVLATFCTKLHQVETSVQSLANDGIKAMAGSGRDDGSHVVMKEMEKALNADLAGTAAVQAAAASGGDEAWPALRSLRSLGRLSQHPPSSVLGKLSGALQAPRRWAGPQLRVVVLTKDAWLHCFHLEASRLQALSASASAGGGVGADVHGTGVEGLEALEAEPQWSLFVPHCNVVAPVAGKARCFEIEESQKRFLRSSRKEMLQAETDESLLRWVKALVEAGAENRSTLQLAAAAPPPPPPPPPPEAAEATKASCSSAAPAAPQLSEEPPGIEDEQPAPSSPKSEEDRQAEPAPVVDADVDTGAAAGTTEDPSLPRPAQQHHLTPEDVFGE